MGNISKIISRPLHHVTVNYDFNQSDSQILLYRVSVQSFVIWSKSVPRVWYQYFATSLPLTCSGHMICSITSYYNWIYGLLRHCQFSQWLRESGFSAMNSIVPFMLLVLMMLLDKIDALCYWLVCLYNIVTWRSFCFRYLVPNQCDLECCLVVIQGLYYVAILGQ